MGGKVYKDALAFKRLIDEEDVTVNIFLRELRSIWKKARPELSPLARLAARNLGLVRPKEGPLKAMEEVWSLNKIQGKGFSDLEAGLVRLGKD